MQVLCLSVAPLGTAPSLRFRCEAFFPLLASRGIHVSHASFFTAAEYAALKSTRGWRTAWPILCGFARRLSAAHDMRRYDVVWLLRQAAPIGPPLIETMIARILEKPIVFDIDDAIWLGNRDNRAFRLARWPSKTSRIVRLSSAVMAGNAFLATYSSGHNARTVEVPTSVDTVCRYNLPHQHRDGRRALVGWTGSRSTNRYLLGIRDILGAGVTANEYDVAIISDRRPPLSFPFDFLPWSTKTEIRDLRSFDIGVMPLDDTLWERGKCGLKAIQYMALGIPPVASAVGANRDIIRHGIDGFLCTTAADWISALRALAFDPGLRQEMGLNGRKRVEAHYSNVSQVDRIADVLRGAAERSLPVPEPMRP